MVEENKNEVVEENLEADPYTRADGKLRVDGNVMLGSVQERSRTVDDGKGNYKEKVTNVIKTIGYRMTMLDKHELYEEKKEEYEEKLKQLLKDRENKELGEEVDRLKEEKEKLFDESWMYIEKTEAIDLVRKMGVTNATIRTREREAKDKHGNVISTQINLNLQNIQGERKFTSADRIFPVYELGSDLKVVKPHRLAIDKEKCTDRLWKVIEMDYKKKKSRNKTSSFSRITADEKMKRIDEVFNRVNFPGAENPFDKK